MGAFVTVDINGRQRTYSELAARPSYAISDISGGQHTRFLTNAPPRPAHPTAFL